jgi:hypothetical protein
MAFHRYVHRRVPALENIYGRLQVCSRTAAVLRAFPDLAAQDRYAPPVQR